MIALRELLVSSAKEAGIKIPNNLYEYNSTPTGMFFVTFK